MFDNEQPTTQLDKEIIKHCQEVLWHNNRVHGFTFPSIIEGTSKKVLQFLMPQEPIYNKNFYFNEQNIYYEHCCKVKKSFK